MGSDRIDSPYLWYGGISIHASRVGSDLAASRISAMVGDFNPRFPRGKRPLVESSGTFSRNISIHASRVGSDPGFLGAYGLTCRFQSTLPAWEATEGLDMPKPKGLISIHASRVGSDQEPGQVAGWGRISIHASRVGSDVAGYHRRHLFPISIHASRVGSDAARPARNLARRYFNPRFPRGKRLIMSLPPNSFQSYFNPRFPRGKRLANPDKYVFAHLFQSTLPAWEATSFQIRNATRRPIFQSTLPAWEATIVISRSPSSSFYFNPRFPRGKRRGTWRK